MKILRNAQVQELVRLLEESKEKDTRLTAAMRKIGLLQDALLTEKRCHMTVAAGAAQAMADGVDLREELDEIALALRADIARLEEWFVSDEV